MKKKRPELGYIAVELRPLARPVAELRQDPQNARRHPDANMRAITASLKAHGQRKPLVIRNDGTVLAGNGTLLAALGLEWAHLACVVYDGPEDQARAFALADNRAGELAEWEPVALADALEAATKAGLLEATGFDDDGLKAAIKAAQLALPEEGDDDAPTPDLDKPAVSQAGELFALGEHRLLCGDSSVAENVERLLAGEQLGAIYADPPYGMNLDVAYDGMHRGSEHRNTGRRFRPVAGDNQSFDPALWLAIWTAPERFWWGADYYRARIPEGGSWVVWDKRANDSGMDLDRVLGASFELCWSEQPHRREIARVLWSGHHGMQGEDTRARVHPTQKPTGLAEWFFGRWVPAGAIVGDPFAGSGSTLIACARTGRRCFAVELDPRYCDVIRRRWTIWARAHEVDPGSGALDG